jgi:hypothetical protein
MQRMQSVSDLVEENGKTVRENNSSKQHTIPLGTLVEVNCDYIDEHGLRMFVGRYERDCDGTPLYGLTFKTQDDIELYKRAGVNPEVLNMVFCSGFSEDSLIIIR